MTVVLSESMCCVLQATTEILGNIFGHHLFPWPRTKIVLKDMNLSVVEEKANGEDAERTVRVRGRFWVNRNGMRQPRGFHNVDAYFRLRKSAEAGRGFDTIRSIHFDHALKVDDKLYIASFFGREWGVLARWNPHAMDDYNSTLAWFAKP